MFEEYNWAVRGWTGKDEQMEWQKTKGTSRALLESSGSVKKAKDEWWKSLGNLKQPSYDGRVWQRPVWEPRKLFKNMGKRVGAMGPAVAEERGRWERREIKKTPTTKWQRGHTGGSGENRRKDDGSLGRPKDAESYAGIGKEMPCPGAGRQVRPGGRGCQGLKMGWMRWEKGAGREASGGRTRFFPAQREGRGEARQGERENSARGIKTRGTQ